MRSAAVVCCLVCCLVESGCFRWGSGAHRHHHRDHHGQAGDRRPATSLSEAADRAADADAAREPVRRRRPARRHDHHDHHAGGTVVVVGSGVAATASAGSAEPRQLQADGDEASRQSLGLRVAYLQVGEEGLDDGVAYRLLVDTELGERWSVAVSLGFIDLDFDRAHAPVAGLTDPYAIELGVSGIGYLRPREAAFSPFLGAGIAVSSLQWDYAHALVDEYGHRIEDDGVGSFVCEGIVGLQLISTPRLQCTVSCRPRLWFFGSTTEAGFDNDLFDAVAGVEWGGSIAYRF